MSTYWIMRAELNIFNATATRIWELLDGKRNLKDIAGLLCREFKVEYSQALKETQEFIQEF